MSDVFISYARQDRPRARALAGALGRLGWSVWWDRRIPPGKAFDRVIEQALDEARCVVVLWSSTSIGSDWVGNEAAEGRRRGILIPAVLEEGIRVPLEFRRIQAASLADWDEQTPGHEGFESLAGAITDLLAAHPSGAEDSARPGAAGKSGRRRAGSSRAGTAGPRKAVPDGAWIDPRTGLMWTIADNGRHVDWRDAVGYSQRLRLGGFNDWRLPAIDELEELYDETRTESEYHVREPFRLSGWHVWSSTLEGLDAAWAFQFLHGRRTEVRMVQSAVTLRALCVRPTGDRAGRQ